MAVAYLNWLARLYLSRVRPQVIAIAGDRGKTVVKRVLAGLLQERMVTRANPRSYNTEVGLPLAVLGLEIDPRRWAQIVRTLIAATWRAVAADWGTSAPRVLVLEYGARNPGDMAELLRTAQPDWAVITPLGSEGEPEMLDVLKGEMEILATAVRSRHRAWRVVAAEDDPRLAGMAKGFGMSLHPADLCHCGGGFAVKGEDLVYLLGPDVVGGSGTFAALATIRIGEMLFLEPKDIQGYLARVTGLETEPESVDKFLDKTCGVAKIAA
jgi:hypothetical protein